MQTIVQELSSSMEKMHKKVADVMKSNRDRKRKKINENIKPYKFGLGDYGVDHKKSQKLLVIGFLKLRI